MEGDSQELPSTIPVVGVELRASEIDALAGGGVGDAVVAGLGEALVNIVETSL